MRALISDRRAAAVRRARPIRWEPRTTDTATHSQDVTARVAVQLRAGLGSGRPGGTGGRGGGWTTVDLVWRESAERYHARNPFPVGGVVEDPATGAAAAAFGGYLRELGLVTRPGTIAIRQGEDMGRPSELLIEVSPRDPRTRVTGQAVPVSGASV
ncbi:hypothetical protein SVIOM342S_00625 [Streptomyces violaceorubidus]